MLCRIRSSSITGMFPARRPHGIQFVTPFFAVRSMATVSTNAVYEVRPPLPRRLPDGIQFGTSRTSTSDSEIPRQPASSFDYEQFCDVELAKKKTDGSYRYFNSINRLAKKFPQAETRSSKTVTVWCSNDYLGMSRNPHALETIHRTLDEYGAGAGGTRNISGNNKFAESLESTVAQLHRKESGLVFSSCYVANDAALSILGSKITNMVFISDSLNHASMIQGIRHSGAHKRIFKHNDMEDLERILASLPRECPKLIAFESVYSMSGTIGKVREIVKLARQYGALTFLDEVHAVGMYGKTGAGVAEHLDWDLKPEDYALNSVANQVDIISGTFGKAYGGVGGYIAASASIIDFVRSYAPGFIFTTSLPPATMAGAEAAIKYQQQTLRDRQLQQLHTRAVKDALKELDLPIMPNPSHIIPVLIGGARHAKMASDMLMERHGVYVQAINHPTVPVGAERLRITPTPGHTRELRNQLVQALDMVWYDLGLKRRSDWVKLSTTSDELRDSLEAVEVPLWNDAQLGLKSFEEEVNIGGPLGALESAWEMGANQPV